MKRLLCLLLCLLALAPIASAEPEGITVDDYIAAVIGDYTGEHRVASAVSEYGNRKAFMVGIKPGDAMEFTMAMGYTFEGSDIVEYITTVGADDAFTQCLFTPMSKAATAEGRLAESNTWLNAILADIGNAFSDDWANNVLANGYYLNVWSARDNSGGTIFVWLNEASNHKNKVKAADEVPSTSYPVVNFAMQFLQLN